MPAPPTHGFTLPDTRSAELFRDRWVCLVDARNPVLDAGRLRLEDLARLPWVAPYYRRGPSPSAAPVTHQFELLGIRPRIAVRVESYLAVGPRGTHRHHRARASGAKGTTAMSHHGGPDHGTVTSPWFGRSGRGCCCDGGAGWELARARTGTATPLADVCADGS